VVPIGPILTRELRTLARRPRTFWRRCSFSAVLPLVLGLIYALAHVMSPASLSPRGVSWFAFGVFANVVFIQITFTIWVVPACVATAIAEEKERRTLSFLAMTRLTSAEIVVGKLAAGLLQYAAWLLTSLPILILLPVFGGLDPRAVLLATAATLSTAYCLAGLSILVSTTASRAAIALGQTIGLATLWIVVPILVQVIAPGSNPQIWKVVQPINDWVLASSPSSLLLTVWWFGPSPGWSLSGAVAWMIGLQLTGGSLLAAWAVARFRKACRCHEETQGSSEDAESGDPPEPSVWESILWFAAALGTYASVVSRDTAQASNWALIPVLLLSLSFLACYLTPRNTSVILGAASAPLVNWLALVSSAEIREVVVTYAGTKPPGVIRQVGVSADQRPGTVLAAFLLAIGGMIAGALWLSRKAVARLDGVARHPDRARSQNSEPSNEALTRQARSSAAT
jgi:ABC-type transport system involved in multi-copper enzyme maturation permease subunit